MEIERTGFLKDVLPEDFLELSDGEVVKNLKGLVVALEGMNDEDFGLHVYGEQNDFAEWIMEAYWDEDLAGKVLGIRDKKKMVKFFGKVLKKAEKGNRIVVPKRKDVLGKIGELE